MNNLEIEHLAPYLEYGLKLRSESDPDVIFVLSGLSNPFKTTKTWFLTGEIRQVNTTRLRSHVFNTESDDSKHSLRPMLVPLSKIPREVLEDIGLSGGASVFDIENLKYSVVKYLFKNHYDVFGLIDAGLAFEKQYTHEKVA